MEERRAVYFVSDVHLGLGLGDPAGREARFVKFLKEIPRDGTRAVCLLGDIWDFWYEYRDVVPREGARVVSELIQLMDDGIDVYYCPGNHDIWTYSFFESLGMKKILQPHYIDFDGRHFCLGHGDCLGGARRSYRFMQKIFHCRFAQVLFSTLHPWIAYRFGMGWSDSNRRTHKPYHFECGNEPLYAWAEKTAEERDVDFFVFGHFHDGVDAQMPGGQRFVILDDWISGGTPHAVWTGAELVTSF